jgi:DNA-binding transcriptional regulator YhcF (GntR family)
LTGLKPETISREFQKLKKQGVISIERGGLRVLNIHSVISHMPMNTSADKPS